MATDQISLPNAASVVLLREATEPEPFEVYMLRRPNDARFAPGLYTFPGGVLDPADYTLGEEFVVPLPAGQTIADLSTRFQSLPTFVPATTAAVAALLVCGVRELFEETGILLARQEDGTLITLDNEAYWGALREDLLAEAIGFDPVLRDNDLTLAPDDLIYFGHWITPENSPIRFDTHFFLANCPAGQLATHWPGEMEEGEWVGPRAALTRFERGEFPMWPVQEAHLRRFAAYDSLEALFAHGRTKQVPPILIAARVLPEEVARCW